MNSFPNQLSTRLSLLLIIAISFLLDNPASAVNSSPTVPSQEAINSIPSIEFSPILAEKLESLIVQETELLANSNSFQDFSGDPGSFIQSVPTRKRRYPWGRYPWGRYPWDRPIPNPGSPIPNLGSPIPNPGSPIPNPGSPIPNPRPDFPR
ncbi:MAG: hypothetical protein KME40_32600 [Komarekiella atlantica HA4396-MV6]|jgi:hypothetical protein|nr:hypothetical protein [Komarekiella atlantica HA4396-MV6]